MPPSPWIGSTNTATTFWLRSATWRTASRSFSGTRTKPCTSGSKPACTLRLPVAERVASERPWKAFSMTMIAGSAMPRSWPYLRATLMAASFASSPELQKNTSSRPVISAIRSAACSCSGIRKRLDVWIMRPICSVSARTRRGWAWPRVFTAMPASASRYFRSDSSYNQTPWPRTNATGRRA